MQAHNMGPMNTIIMEFLRLRYSSQSCIGNSLLWKIFTDSKQQESLSKLTGKKNVWSLKDSPRYEQETSLAGVHPDTQFPTYDGST